MLQSYSGGLASSLRVRVVLLGRVADRTGAADLAKRGGDPAAFGRRGRGRRHSTLSESSVAAQTDRYAGQISVFCS